MEKLFTLLDANYNEMVGIRRHLHEYPELIILRKKCGK